MMDIELLKVLLMVNGAWAILGPLVVFIFVFRLRAFQPKYQGQKVLGVEKTTWEVIFIFTIGGIAFWLFYIFVEIEERMQK